MDQKMVFFFMLPGGRIDPGPQIHVPTIAKLVFAQLCFSTDNRELLANQIIVLYIRICNSYKKSVWFYETDDYQLWETLANFSLHSI